LSDGRVPRETFPPIYVKPFVKRQKNDAADAEAITERSGVRPCTSWRSSQERTRRRRCSFRGSCDSRLTIQGRSPVPVATQSSHVALAPPLTGAL